MPGLDMLDVAIGVIFMYLLASLVCSAAVECLEALLRFRGSDLEHGIRELLQDDPALLKKIYDHPLVNSLYPGVYGEVRPDAESLMKRVLSWKRSLPSYIPARNFALAILETFAGAPVFGATSASGVAPAATALPPQPQINLNGAPAAIRGTKAFEAVATLVAAAQNDAAKARENVEEWFNSGMDRVSGWYKRRTQYMLFGVGLIAAALLNLDTIGVAKSLAANKNLRQQVVEGAIKAVDGPTITAAVQAAKARADKTTSTTSTGAAAAAGKTETTGTAGTTATVTTATTPATTSTTPATTATTPATTGTTPATTSASGTTATTTTTADALDEAKAKAEALENVLGALSVSQLPIGWHHTVPKGDDLVFNILGILITACAVSLGAPFWFDTLNKIIVVRSTVKPKEKSGAEASKDAQK